MFEAVNLATFQPLSATQDSEGSTRYREGSIRLNWDPGGRKTEISRAIRIKRRLCCSQDHPAHAFYAGPCGPYSFAHDNLHSELRGLPKVSRGLHSSQLGSAGSGWAAWSWRRQNMHIYRGQSGADQKTHVFLDPGGRKTEISRAIRIKRRLGCSQDHPAHAFYAGPCGPYSFAHVIFVGILNSEAHKATRRLQDPHIYRGLSGP